VTQLVSTLVLLAAPRAALACSVCFGQSDSPLAKATNMGIYFLIAVTVGVLGAFASFFIYLIRRARAYELAAAAQEGTV
jgi:hypothetical protein